MKRKGRGGVGVKGEGRGSSSSYQDPTDTYSLRCLLSDHLRNSVLVTERGLQTMVRTLFYSEWMENYWRLPSIEKTQ